MDSLMKSFKSSSGKIFRTFKSTLFDQIHIRKSLLLNFISLFENSIFFI